MDASRVADARPAFAPPSIVQFYSIQIAPSADGRMFVGVEATVCEHEGELESVDMGSERVGSLDEALTAIRVALLTDISN
jgi:hypothetical protein